MVASFEIIIQDFPQLIFTYHLFYIQFYAGLQVLKRLFHSITWN